ncbi:hypothetical protein H4Q31_03660 [Cohnella lubricantis]|uniref:Uncharacterized protein n=1 Tax=Cohnella lubricantis TaxID=2163172 RepID=A0A841TAZ3_9BACL|nr:hypothetical protein [Cohnella lubricantis]
MIGVGAQIWNGSTTLLIPVILVAIVFLLYKFPPSRFRRGFRARSESARYRQTAKSQARHRREADKAKRRTATFRVIEGTKPRDDEPPTYH